MDLGKAFDLSVSEHPEKTALKSSGAEYSYRELQEEVGSVAQSLKEKGLEGEKIAFSAPNTDRTLITVLGIWYSGNTCVHINPRLEASELPYFLDDSEAELFLYHESIEEKIGKIDDEIETEFTSFDSLGSESAELGSKRSGEALCSITYTSGTTGKPKGVPYQHTRLLHGSIILVLEAQEARDKPLPIEEAVNQRYGEGAKPFSDREIEQFIEEEPWKNDTHAVIYPLYHVSGTNPSFATLLGGGTLLLPDRDIESVMQAIEEENATLTGGVPAQLNTMVELSRSEYDTSSLEYLHTAGGLLTDETRENVIDELTENLCHEYASSETLEMAYSLDNSGALGKQTCLQELKVVRPGTLEEVEEGEKGEVIVNTGGPTVFQGYWNKPEKTAESIEDGWYRTGDLVRIETDGRLWFEGRADDLIISGGENISPANVENAIVSMEDVKQAGVIGVEDDEWGQRIVAFIESESFDADEIDSYLKKSELADFKRPKEYIEIDEMPLKETSGVDRKKLAEIYSEEVI